MKKLFLICLFFFVIFEANAKNAELITLDLSGKEVDLQKEKGKVVIVSFWASWCIDCRKELPILEEIYQQCRSQNLEIIGISIDSKNKRSEVKKIAEQLSFTNSMLVDAKKISFEHPNSIPINYVIGKNGEVVAILNGGDGNLSKKDFEKILNPLLGQ